jgi:hypothetical protein
MTQDFTGWTADDFLGYLADLDHSKPRWQPAERDIDAEIDVYEESLNPFEDEGSTDDSSR